MLEPHTATFPCGYLSRKSEAAVAFQNLDPSIKQHPWFTTCNTHTLSSPSSPPPFPISICLNFFPFSFSSLFFIPSLLKLCPFIPLCFAPHPALQAWVYSPQGTSARLSATDLLIGFSLSAVNTVLVWGRLSDTDRLVLNLSHWLTW